MLYEKNFTLLLYCELSNVIAPSMSRRVCSRQLGQLVVVIVLLLFRTLRATPRASQNMQYLFSFRQTHRCVIRISAVLHNNGARERNGAVRARVFTAFHSCSRWSRVLHHPTMTPSRLQTPIPWSRSIHSDALHSVRYRPTSSVPCFPSCAQYFVERDVDFHADGDKRANLTPFDATRILLSDKKKKKMKRIPQLADVERRVAIACSVFFCIFF